MAFFPFDINAIYLNPNQQLNLVSTWFGHDGTPYVPNAVNEYHDLKAKRFIKPYDDYYLGGHYGTVVWLLAIEEWRKVTPTKVYCLCKVKRVQDYEVQWVTGLVYNPWAVKYHARYTKVAGLKGKYDPKHLNLAFISEGVELQSFQEEEG